MPIPILSPDPSLFAEKYLLRDDFNDTRVAGTVNGTSVTPGPGTRVVTDTDGDAISITSRQLSFANPNSSWTSHGLVYSIPFARVAGRMFLWVCNSVSGQCESGFVSSVAVAEPYPQDAFKQAATSLFVNNGTTTSIWEPVTASVEYNLCIDMRTVGSFYFVKGGTQYPQWKLFYPANIRTDATVYFVHDSYNSVSIAGKMHVPVATWLPSPIASDSFNRANGTLGTTDGAGHTEANGGGGLTWTSQLGTWAISANTVMSSALDGSGISIATVQCLSANVVTQVIVTRAGNEVGKCLRYVDTNNYLLVQHDGTNCQLIERVGGVNTTRVTAAAAIGAGAVTCVLDGTSARLYLNRNLIGSYAALVNTTSTTHGIFTTNTGSTLDDFVVWARGNEEQYSALDRWTI